MHSETVPGSLFQYKPARSIKARVDEPLSDGKYQLLGVRWPGSALAHLTYWPGTVECFASAGQSGAGPPHSKELPLPLDQSFLKSMPLII